MKRDQVIPGNSICPNIGSPRYVYCPQRNLLVRCDKEEAPEQLHQLGVLAVARVHYGHYGLVVAVGQYRLLSPASAPHDAGQHNWEKLLHCNGALYKHYGPEVLEPEVPRPGPASEGPRCVGEEVIVGWSALGCREHGYAVPVFQHRYYTIYGSRKVCHHVRSERNAAFRRMRG